MPLQFLNVDEHGHLRRPPLATAQAAETRLEAPSLQGAISRIKAVPRGVKKPATRALLLLWTVVRSRMCLRKSAGALFDGPPFLQAVLRTDLGTDAKRAQDCAVAGLLPPCTNQSNQATSWPADTAVIGSRCVPGALCGACGDSGLFGSWDKERCHPSALARG